MAVSVTSVGSAVICGLVEEVLIAEPELFVATALTLK
jgi:hypothetical protein